MYLVIAKSCGGVTVKDYATLEIAKEASIKLIESGSSVRIARELPTTINISIDVTEE